MIDDSEATDSRAAASSPNFFTRFPWRAAVIQFGIFIVVIWVIASATFFLARAIPGGPFTQERYFPDSIRKQMEARYNLDVPVGQQYLNYLGGLLRFDLGPSFYEEGRTVNEIIAERFPNSAMLGMAALFIAVAIGVPLGMIAAWWHLGWPDYLSLGIAIIGVSVPNFILASILQYIFAYKMNGFLPAAGLEEPRAFLMPSLALACFALAFVTRLVRAEMLEVLQQEYMLAARARGIGPAKLALKHALRNALLPVVTYLGPLIAALFTGSFVIEKIFDVPGLGRQFVQSIYNRDYGLILGVTLFYSALLVGLNMTIDLLYRWIDPRVESSTRSS